MISVNTLPARDGRASGPGEIMAASAKEVLYTIDGASFEIEGRMLLHPLTLTLSTRCVYGLLGHNGSGQIHADQAACPATAADHGQHTSTEQTACRMGQPQARTQNCVPAAAITACGRDDRA